MTSPNCPVCFAARPAAGTGCPRCGHSYAAPISLSKNDDTQVLPTVSLSKQPDAATGPRPSSPPMAPPPRFEPMPSATWGQQHAPQPPPPPLYDPSRPPAPPVGPGVPPAGPSRTRRDRKLLVIAGGGIVGAVLVAVLIFALSQSGTTPHNATAAANDSAGAQQPIASAPPSQPSVAASQPATSSSTPSTVAPPTPTLPVTASRIDFRPVAGSAHLPQVASMLDTYFSGINAHNGRKAASVFAPNGAINPHDSKQVALFSHGISTTHDDEIAVESIKPASFAGEAGLAVRLRFRSRQNASLGPHNETCTDWSLTQKLVGAGSGYQLLGSERVADTSC